MANDAPQDDALRFLSHDAREGHSSTLALIELQRIKAEPLDAAALMDAIERNARRSLAAIDNFVELAHARTHPLQRDALDLAQLLHDSVADAWPLAQSGGVQVTVVAAPARSNFVADRQLLSAALAKLLRDVIAQAPRGAEVACTLREQGGDWLIEIVNHGTGLPQPGWALAEVVATRHGGRVEAESGTASQVLRLVLPRR